MQGDDQHREDATYLQGLVVEDQIEEGPLPMSVAGHEMPGCLAFATGAVRGDETGRMDDGSQRI